MCSSNRMNLFEQDFEDAFKLFKKQGISADDLRVILKPALYQTYLKTVKKFNFWLLMIAVLASVFIGRTEKFSLLITAIGRLLLINILPLWDWTALYNSKCLIESTPVERASLPAHVLEKSETDPANCGPCSTLDGVPTAVNANYSFIEESYLERGLPLIITNSHVPVPPKRFFELMLENTRGFLESDPCDLATNLVMQKFFTIQLAFAKIQALYPTEKWYLQLRNCQFKAVKSSRLFITRPYYYPFHLEPFYSSWLLMANHYADLKQDVDLFGLILVQQISGSFEFRLSPKRPCNLSCPTLNIRLDEGEALMFTTDVWTLHYSSDTQHYKDTTASIATILEIDWRL